MDAPSCRQRAHEAILRRISRRDLLPGEPIVASELAVELGLSRTPVTEALRTLEAQGLVVGRTNRVWRVAKYSLEKTWQLYELRQGFEMLAARTMAEHGEPEHIRKLRAICEEMAQAASRGDIALAAQQDFAFHRHLYEHCGNGFLTTMANGGIVLVTIELMLGGVENRRAIERGDLSWIADSHKDLLSAIEVRDPKAAEEAARAHVRESMDDARSYLQPRPLGSVPGDEARGDPPARAR